MWACNVRVGVRVRVGGYARTRVSAWMHTAYTYTYTYNGPFKNSGFDATSTLTTPASLKILSISSPVRTGTVLLVATT